LDEHVGAIERGLAAVYGNPEMIEAFDRIQAVIGRYSLSIKQRLLEVGKLLTEVRYAGRIIH
jgi:hypothetical protein